MEDDPHEEEDAEAGQAEDDDDDDDYTTTNEFPSPSQEYFVVPQESKCAEVLAAYEARIPPVFTAPKKWDLYSRGTVKLSQVAKIKALTSRPSRSLPVVSLKTWNDLTPDVKLPDIRHRSDKRIFYSRGKLGQKLSKETGEFDLSDPQNKRKTLQIQGYSALHDPHCKTYLSRPSVVKHLRKQKLINNRKEVLCNVHEFNKYRSYLGELFNEQVKRRIDDNEAMKDLERNINRSIFARQRRNEDEANKAYQLQHVALNAAYDKAKKKAYIANINNWKKKLEEIEHRKAEEKVTRTGAYTKKHWNAHMTRRKAHENEANRKKHTLTRIAYAEIKNDYVTKYDKFVKLALYERFKADHAAVLVARDDQIDDMEQLVEETLKRSRRKWLENYDAFITACRKNPLKHYKAHLEAEKRVKWLMRKYFDMWVHNARRQKKRRPDADHQTLFNMDSKLKPFVENLKAHPEELEAAAQDEAGKESKKRSRKTKIRADAETNEDFPVDDGSRGDYNRRNLQSKKQAGGDRGDGHEADIDEADEYIDKVVARYKFEQQLLKEKLRQNAPMVQGRRTMINTLFSKETINRLDEEQEEQKEIINFLQDINDVAADEDTTKGWKAMHL